MFEIFTYSLIFLASSCAILSFSILNFQTERQRERGYYIFRNNYLIVYLCMVMSDWLQGPYVYALYKSYGYSLKDIGVLFITGFMSSAIFGTVISSWSDQYGRRKFCLLFCVLYSISCLLKLSKSFSLLIVGRVTGGISTSLLFSVFESWMVSEHFSKSYSSDSLSSTFTIATYLNGLIAIISGILANGVVSLTNSYVSPFMAAVFFLLVGGSIIKLSWTENYGEVLSQSNSRSSLSKGLAYTFRNFKVFCIGSIIALFESSMYIFVFLWGVVLELPESELIDGQQIPYGLIFSCFMVCLMLGSIGFKYGDSVLHLSSEFMLPPLLFLSAFSMSVPIVSKNKEYCYYAFCLFEICCGFYFPLIGNVRSKYVPEETRATVMNIFRVPLNIIVAVVLMNVSSWSHQFIFGICTFLLAFALSFSLSLNK
jgi:MFS family permease